jgi:hypothetical protein
VKLEEEVGKGSMEVGRRDGVEGEVRRKEEVSRHRFGLGS